MTTSILNITDGTTIISLLGGRDSWFLQRWVPGLAQPKGGGTWQQSSLSDGRRLVNRQLDNVIETLEIKASRQGADDLIEISQDLIRLLEKAVQYWTAGWQNEPVWLEARASCETKTRYAVIHNYSIPQLNNPYSQPFLSDPRVLDEITLLVERSHWLRNEPGSGTAIELSALEVYSGVTFGNVDSADVREPSTGEDVYIANADTVANLTHIFINAAGANLLGAAVPYDLLPAVPAVGDRVYFGINSIPGDSGPFASVVFDLSIAQNDCTIVWEQRGVAGFVGMSVQDNTNADGALTGQPFDTTGINSIHFMSSIPADFWTVAVINFVTAWWIRARVTAIGAAPSPPRQQNRQPYRINWPYTEVNNDQTLGDLSAKSLIKVIQQSDSSTTAGGPDPLYFFHRMIVGLRTLERGQNFTAYLNFSSAQNPAGVTVTTISGTATIINNFIFPAGKVVRWAPGATPNFTDVVEITLDPTIAPEFYGTYHVFLRTNKTADGLTTYGIRLRVQSGTGSSIYTTPQDVPEVSDVDGRTSFMDLGTITIPGPEVLGIDDITDQVTLTIQGTSDGAGGQDLHLVDLILMPADEWIADLIDTTDAYTGAMTDGRYMEIDGLIRPKNTIRSLIREIANDRVVAIWQSIANGGAIIQHSGAQRLWFTTVSQDGGILQTKPHAGASVQLTSAARYFGLRGSR